MRIIVTGVLAVTVLTAALFLTAVPQAAEGDRDPAISLETLTDGKRLFSSADQSFEKIAGKISEDKTLPIGRIEKHAARNGWGYVIFLPQTHKNPASQTSDKANDSAEVAQNEIKEIMDFILENSDMEFVMAEGDLYGKAPEEKIKNLSRKIALRNSLSEKLERLKDSASKNPAARIAAAKTMVKGQKAIKYLDRDISLAGASYRAKAEGRDFELYGAENKETRDECTVLVRDYIYQGDRIKALGNGSADSGKRMTFKEKILEALTKKASASQGQLSPGLNREFADQGTAEGLVVGENDSREVADLVGEIDKIFVEIEGLEAGESALSARRSDNPYGNVTDIGEMSELHQKTEKKIEEVVIRRRNRETAENFVRGLKEQKTNAGIIQFGAGHEDGLVEELNKAGLSVLVISSSEVEDRDGVSGN